MSADILELPIPPVLLDYSSQRLANDLADILYLPVPQNVMFIGCFHTMKFDPSVYGPAIGEDRPLTCPHCFDSRQWRFTYEEPSVRRGRLFGAGY